MRVRSFVPCASLIAFAVRPRRVLARSAEHPALLRGEAAGPVAVEPADMAVADGRCRWRGR